MEFAKACYLLVDQPVQQSVPIVGRGDVVWIVFIGVTSLILQVYGLLMRLNTMTVFRQKLILLLHVVTCLVKMSVTHINNLLLIRVIILIIKIELEWVKFWFADLWFLYQGFFCFLVHQIKVVLVVVIHVVIDRGLARINHHVLVQAHLLFVRRVQYRVLLRTDRYVGRFDFHFVVLHDLTVGNQLLLRILLLHELFQNLRWRRRDLQFHGNICCIISIVVVHPSSHVPVGVTTLCRNMIIW